MDACRVSIIVLTWNQPAWTAACLASIRAHTTDGYEIILVDNGSEVPARSLFHHAADLRILRNEFNGGFVGGCNRGASEARGEFLLFLNNDTEVTAGWLEPLVEVMDRRPRCGAVGSKLVHFDGKLQEAGSIIWSDGTTQGYGRGDDPNRSEYSFVRCVDYCSGACLMVRAEVFQKLGGFDERYAPAYYEDSDLCMAIRQCGMEVWYQPASVVRHREYGSTSPVQAQERMRINRAVFVQKWSAQLRHHLPPSVSACFRARIAGQPPSILVIDDQIPQPELGMGFPRAHALVSQLAEEGMAVTFFPMERRGEAPLAATALRQKGIEVITEEYRTLSSFLTERRKQFDRVWISRPHNFALASRWVWRTQPDAFLLYDAEAIFSARDALKYALLGQRFKHWWSRLRLRRECAMAKRADAVIAVSPKEAEQFLAVRRDDRVFTWGHPVTIRLQETPFEERNGILFVGGGIHPGYPNEDAILFFLESVWPLLADRLAGPLTIVGAVTSPAVRSHAQENVRILGQVPDLSSLYASHRVFIAPTRFAAGIPWKVHEAMSYGLPCVISRLLETQLVAPSSVVLSAESPAEYVEQILMLYEDEKQWRTLRENAARFLKQTCDPSVLRRQLQAILGLVDKFLG